MPFNSPGFLLLLLPTVLLYYVRRTERWQHTLLFLSSFAFYWFAGVRDLVLLLTTIALNYALSFVLDAKRAAPAAVVLNLGILGFFKYRYFVAGLFWHSPELAAQAAASTIPLGISFYIFQLIAYHVDRARGRVERENSFSRLLLYVLFFPHHQAGPIMRPGQFLPQFVGAKDLDLDEFARGVRWLLYGLAQKVIADRIAVHVDAAFLHDPDTTRAAWAATLGFTAQIYFDFAGYSNMAVGLGHLFGYQLDRNFNQPYVAASPSEFWERWHITLSAWLRDYLYISLGGNRRGKVRTYVNLMATMVLGGLWHGASWNFVVWGALHGLLLVVFRLAPIERRSRVLGTVLCQLGVLLCWVPFRAHTFGQTFSIWRAMAGVGVPFGSLRQWAALAAMTGVFYLVHMGENLVLDDEARRERALRRWSVLPDGVRGTAAALALAGCALMLLDGTTFIYFRF